MTSQKSYYSVWEKHTSLVGLWSHDQGLFNSSDGISWVLMFPRYHDLTGSVGDAAGQSSWGTFRWLQKWTQMSLCEVVGSRTYTITHDTRVFRHTPVHTYTYGHTRWHSGVTDTQCITTQWNTQHFNMAFNDLNQIVFSLSLSLVFSLSCLKTYSYRNGLLSFIFTGAGGHIACVQ